jgi:predicted mannosyl-3-phosphoglycerate phosphatase (HAD superfamily)
VDIDGTLTPHALAVFEARPDAATALREYSGKGYRIVYLTARVPLFQAGLPGWLQQNGFPDGSLHVAQTSEERDQVDQFKARILDEYVRSGWQLAYAYGDSSTDFLAYASAGISRVRVFALVRRWSEDCQVGVYRACLQDWTEHLPYIENEVPRAR